MPLRSLDRCAKTTYRVVFGDKEFYRLSDAMYSHASIIPGEPVAFHRTERAAKARARSWGEYKPVEVVR